MIDSPFVHFEDLSLAASSEPDDGRKQDLLQRTERALDEWEQMLHAWVADKGNAGRSSLPTQQAA
jgi:hypothetical protein